MEIFCLTHSQNEIIDLSPNIFYFDDFGRNLLSYSAQFDLIYVIRYILDIDNDKVFRKDNGGLSPLMYACIYGNIRSVKLLLIYDHIEFDDNENNPLMISIIYQQNECSEYLLDNGNYDLRYKNTFQLVCDFSEFGFYYKFLEKFKLRLEEVDSLYEPKKSSYKRLLKIYLDELIDTHK